jgi:hypothetical protein
MNIMFGFTGNCRMHSSYDPETDGQPADRKCPGCESLYVIWLYTRIAKKRAASGEGLITSNPEKSVQSGTSTEVTHA